MFNRMIKLFLISIILLGNLNLITLANVRSVKNHLISVPVNDERVVWQRRPIEITLPVGKERFVTFPGEVQFGYNTQLLPSSLLRVENDNQTLYLLAKQPFKTQRVEARLSNGELILLDIAAKRKADDHPIDIDLPNSVSLNNRFRYQSTDTAYANRANINYVSLIRFAIQQLYAPKRLLKNPMDITRFPMQTLHTVPLFYDNSVVSMPLASWRVDDLYVTAIFIKNNLYQRLHLNPRLLCGDWRAASAYPQTLLMPKGMPANRDATTLFVVSNKPFSQAIQSCLNN